MNASRGNHVVLRKTPLQTNDHRLGCSNSKRGEASESVKKVGSVLEAGIMG